LIRGVFFLCGFVCCRRIRHSFGPMFTGLL
jgi:hypothetical protein